MASLKVKDFFNGRFFEIPKYQRGYAWEKQNVRDLFDDIIESIESNSNHYIGTIVLSKSPNDDEKFFIVDGQQRTTTITLIISALIKALSNEDSLFYSRFYLKEENRYRMTPLNRDSSFFVDLLEGVTGEPKNKSQRFLLESYQEINFKIGDIKDKLKFLKAVEKLEVMEFVENTEGDAIRIFQTVNDRGKLLSSMEKAKSLLIYFSNRYLSKELDDIVNEYFSDIFELYDDIKHLGDEIGINLIKSKNFNEDNLMKYHFVTFSNEDYDPSASYVLQFLKSRLTNLRSGQDGNFDQMKKFILDYTKSLRDFFENCKLLIERANSEPRYFKLFSILNLSATLYPLAVKLQSRSLLETKLSKFGKSNFDFFDLIELIEVRVYKTRGTDPKADIAKFVFGFDERSLLEIENWLIWFNNRWMPKESFQSSMSRRIYGNQALNYILVDYCESINKNNFTLHELKELVSKIPNIEHILSQTPKFEPTALGFLTKEDFMEYEHTFGNLTILEKYLNSYVINKNPFDKVIGYDKSIFSMTKQLSSEIDSKKGFFKSDLLRRTETLVNYTVNRWWSEISVENVDEIVEDELI